MPPPPSPFAPLPTPPPPPAVPGTKDCSTVACLTSTLGTDLSIDRIVLAPGHYALSAQLSVTRQMTIEAAVSYSVVIDAQAVTAGVARRVLSVDASTSIVHLTGLNLTGGNEVGGI